MAGSGSLKVAQTRLLVKEQPSSSGGPSITEMPVLWMSTKKCGVEPPSAQEMSCVRAVEGRVRSGVAKPFGAEETKSPHHQSMSYLHF